MQGFKETERGSGGPQVRSFGHLVTPRPGGAANSPVTRLGLYREPGRATSLEPRQTRRPVKGRTGNDSSVGPSSRPRGSVSSLKIVQGSVQETDRSRWFL